MMRLISGLIYYLSGWKTSGTVPPVKKFVAIAAPHTSNWDFVYGMAARYLFRVNIRYLGKKELFAFPFGFIFRALGGIPVDRTSKHDLVSQVVELFRNHDEFILALAPEGTRSFAPEWKKGFYYIAKNAGVPIVLCFIDFENKTTGIGPLFYPTGNYESDLEEIKSFYRKIKGKYPGNGVR